MLCGPIFFYSDYNSTVEQGNYKLNLVKMAEAGDMDVENIIEQLLAVRGSKPGRQVNLTEAEIRWLCIKSREIFTVQPVLLELEAPIKICGK